MRQFDVSYDSGKCVAFVPLAFVQWQSRIEVVVVYRR